MRRFPDTEEATMLPMGHETILLVDDDASVRAVVGAMLKRLGYRVIMASDGHEGLRMLRHDAQPIDLVLTDVVMPRMSGPAMVAAVRAVDPDVKVLFVSGNPQLGLDGATDLPGPLLAKPFRSIELAIAIRAELDRTCRSASA
jgi:CheY-like chemotaxis protein